MSKIKSILGKTLLNALNQNSFKQAPVAGQVDMSLMHSGVITGVISTAAAANIYYPGQRVKLDTAADDPCPSFVAAAITEYADGIIAFTSKGAAFTKGMAVEVLMDCMGPIVYIPAAAAITAGVVVEAVGAVNAVQTFSAGKKVGKALDGTATVGNLIRVIMNSLAVKA